MTRTTWFKNMFAFAVTAVLLVGGRTGRPRNRKPTFTAGLDSNIIDPVALGCLHETGGNAADEFFGEKLRPRLGGALTRFGRRAAHQSATA
jgi:hypothetical protein